MMTVIFAIVRSFVFLRFQILVCLTIVSFVANAQMGYIRTTFAETYVPITTGNGATPITGGAGTGNFSTTVGASNLDDGTAYIPLPFNFDFAGNTFTTNNFLGVCTNGFIYFSTTNTNFSKVSIFDNSRVYGTGVPNNCLAPWYDDLKLDAVGTNPAGNVLYKIFNSTTTDEDTLIIQYTNINSSFTVVSGTPKQLNFQVWLYKNSGVIEFRYGSATGNDFNQSNESASIAIESAAGGMYHFIDGITGSDHLGNAMLTSKNFPDYNIRFSPGTPSPIAAGTYTVGKTGMYQSLTLAMADLNHRGVAGNVTFTLIDSLYDETSQGGRNIFPLLLQDIQGTSTTQRIMFQSGLGSSKIVAAGSTSNNALVAGPALYNMVTLSTEPILGLFGTDFTTFDKIIFTVPDSNERLDKGIWINNITALDGACYNTFSNVEVKLNRNNNVSAAIYQSSQFIPATAQSGANTGNQFLNIKISNCIFPLTFMGSTSYPDSSTVVGTTACSIFNEIGGDVPNDINNDEVAAYGIKAIGQVDMNMYNNIIRNITCTGPYTLDGICLDNGVATTWNSGTTSIYNNKIYGLLNTNTGAGKLCGININVTPNSTVRIYNNWITGVNNASTVTTGRMLTGILTQSKAATTASGINYYIEHNSININPVDAACSNVCIELGTKNGINHFILNNIISNKTPAQQGNVFHSFYYSPGNYSMGTGAFNYNCFYFSNSANAFFGTTPIGNFVTKQDWDNNITGPGPELQSIQQNPYFANDQNDLHASNPSLDGVATTPSSWITSDIDCNQRVGLNDIGATIISTCGAAPEAGTVVPSDDTPCYGTSVSLSLAGNNFGPGITFQWQESATGSIGTFTNITAATDNVYNTGIMTLSKYYRCIVACATSGQKDSTNIQFVQVLSLPALSHTPTQSFICQPNANAVPIIINAPNSTKIVMPQTGLTILSSYAVQVAPTTSTVYTITATAASGCTRTATTNIVVSQKVYMNEVTASPQNICRNSSTQLSVTGGTTSAYVVRSVPFTKYNGNRGHIIFPINSNDDYKSIMLPKDFTFDFFGKRYDKLFVQINGFISFTSGSTFKYAQTIPTPNKPNGTVAVFQTDLLVSTGSVDTFTVGTYPYRKFIISYDSLQLYINGQATGMAVGQIALLETQNIIECHIELLQNGIITSRTKTVGIENESGTVAFFPANRNDAQFTVTTPESWSFVPSGGGITYSWKPTTGLSAPTSSITTAANLTANTTYTVTATESGGCTSAKVFNIGVSNLDATIVNSPAAVCPGVNASLNAQGITGAMPYTYLWSNGATSSTMSVSVTGDSTYTVTVTDNYGCTKTATHSVSLLQAPTLLVNTNSPLCAGSTLTLSAQGSNLYQWTGPQNFSADTPNVEIAGVTPLEAGIYTLTGTNDLGCQTQQEVDVEINPNDIPLIGANLPVNEGDSLILTCTPADAYQWTGPNNFTSTDQNPVVENMSANTTGDYTVTVTYSNGCTNSSTMNITLGGARMIGLAAAATEKVLQCYPNPAYNVVYVFVPEEFMGATLSVYEAMGKEVPGRVTIDKAIFDLNISHLMAGSYMLQIASSSKVEYLRFTKLQ